MIFGYNFSFIVWIYNKFNFAEKLEFSVGIISYGFHVQINDHKVYIWRHNIMRCCVWTKMKSFFLFINCSGKRKEKMRCKRLYLRILIIYYYYLFMNSMRKVCRRFSTMCVLLQCINDYLNHFIVSYSTNAHKIYCECATVERTSISPIGQHKRHMTEMDV